MQVYRLVKERKRYDYIGDSVVEFLTRNCVSNRRTCTSRETVVKILKRYLDERNPSEPEAMSVSAASLLHFDVTSPIFSTEDLLNVLIEKKASAENGVLSIPLSERDTFNFKVGFFGRCTLPNDETLSKTHMLRVLRGVLCGHIDVGNFGLMHCVRK